MGKNRRGVVATPGQKDSRLAALQTTRSMSLEKAKKLIRKTSDEHKGLFRRLAK